MKKFCLLTIAFSLSIKPNAQQLQLLSPDKTIEISVQINDQLRYSVFADDKKIINESLINMQLNNGNALSKNFKIRSTKSRSVNEIIVTQIPVSKKNISDAYNELEINFKNNFAVIFRAYNDGFAYRIATSFKDSIVIQNETAQFNFTDDAHAWCPIIHKRDDADIYHTSFEELYAYKPLDSLSNNDYMFNPVLINENNNIKVAVTESDLDDYPGMFLKGNSTNSLTASFAPYPLEEKIVEGDYPEMIVSKRADYIAKTNGTRNFPWRCLLVARQDKELPANDQVYRLASPT